MRGKRSFRAHCLLREVLACAVGLGCNSQCIAAPDIVKTDRQSAVEEHALAWSRSVVELKIDLDDVSYVGTGVCIVNGIGETLLLTANHVVTNQGGARWQAISYKPFSAPSNDPAAWHRLGDYADRLVRCGVADSAVIHLPHGLQDVVPTRLADSPPVDGTAIVAFGFAVPEGHMLIGSVAGMSENRYFLAVKLKAGHGDSGGPVFDAITGRLLALISSTASAQMTDRFFAVSHFDGELSFQWSSSQSKIGADTILVDLPVVWNAIADDQHRSDAGVLR